MCQQIVQFCSGSTKPLFYIGALLTALASAAIAYAIYDTQSLTADEGSWTCYLKYLVSLYLLVTALLACYAAHFDQKYSKAALAVLTSINVVLFASAVLIALPIGKEFSPELTNALTGARKLYNYSDPPVVKPSQDNNTPLFPNVDVSNTTSSQASRSGRSATEDGQQAQEKVKSISPGEATKIWDNLQQRGCCGFESSDEWGKKFPKSCCSGPKNDTKDGKIFFICSEVDEAHKQPCIEIFANKHTQLSLVVVIIALVNLYLAVVASFSTYRTLHYNEASQSAYT